MKKLILLLTILLLFTCGCTSSEKDKEIIIALLDTGISSTAIKSENILKGWNYITDSSDTEDHINHGTAVSSVILGCESAKITGISPNAKIVPLVVADKIEGKGKSVSPEILAQALRDSVDKYGASIINVSLGIQKDNPALRSAIEYVQEKGAIVIAAVGNNQSDGLYYPASYNGVVAVGSHDKNSEVSSFTQENVRIDILAPGEDIWLASRNGKTYGAKGTSYSTGYVSAEAYIIWEENPTLTAEEVKNKLYENSHEVDGFKILTSS